MDIKDSSNDNNGRQLKDHLKASMKIQTINVTIIVFSDKDNTAIAVFSLTIFPINSYFESVQCTEKMGSYHWYAKMPIHPRLIISMPQSHGSLIDLLCVQVQMSIIVQSIVRFHE